MRRKHVIKRSFLPVGQGAFYLEQFEGNRNIKVIYYCRSIQNKSIVEDRLKENLKKDEVIHAVFISHLDEDHINGIPFLLEHCKVKKIFFPIITQENISFMKLYNLAKYKDDFAYRFLDNPNQAIKDPGGKNEPELIQIVQYNNNSNREFRNEYRARSIASGHDVKEEIIGKGWECPYLYKWQYIPHNFKREDRIEQLKKVLRLEFEKDITGEELMKRWSDNRPRDRQKIKNAYAAVKGSFNTNSMTLFSGETEKLFNQMDKSYSECYCQNRCVYARKSGCLYMGDYDASGTRKWEELENAYNNYWEHIGCIQIPHHGSKHNFNKSLLKRDSYLVISAGNRNKFRHPYANVIKEIMKKRQVAYIVTEDMESAIYLYIFKK